jgi:hypothetical protein
MGQPTITATSLLAIVQIGYPIEYSSGTGSRRCVHAIVQYGRGKYFQAGQFPMPSCKARPGERRPDETLAVMSSWQYAQLTITVNGRSSQADARTILWHGPGQGVGENYSDSEQTVLELLNRFGGQCCVG